MAELFSDESLTMHAHHQSVRHAKLLPRLESEFGKLEVEFQIAPGIVVDCASPERRLVIELHGPSHYLMDLVSGEQILNGPTKFKNRRIHSLGWSVRNINLTKRM